MSGNQDVLKQSSEQSEDENTNLRSSCQKFYQLTEEQVSLSLIALASYSRLCQTLLQSPMVPINIRGQIRQLVAKHGRANSLVADPEFIAQAETILTQLQQDNNG